MRGLVQMKRRADDALGEGRFATVVADEGPHVGGQCSDEGEEERCEPGEQGQQDELVVGAEGHGTSLVRP